MNTFKVRWKSGIAHLSEDGRYTICGKAINLTWTTDQDATAIEFVEQVSRRCSSCRLGAEFNLLVDMGARNYAEEDIAVDWGECEEQEDE